jgi:hypothetical protein
MIEELTIGELYSNEEIFKSLKVSNAGGIRLSLQGDAVLRAVIMTSLRDFHGAGENPYQDRMEGGILTYTAMGRVGEQALVGANSRLIEQTKFRFPIHAFVLTASRRDKSVGPKRWQYLGLLEYLRHYPESQLDAEGNVRRVVLFEFKIHDEYRNVPLANEMGMATQALEATSLEGAEGNGDNEVVESGENERGQHLGLIQEVRGKLLAMRPRGFEVFVKDLLVHCGLRDVCVTQLSADGGVDVVARMGGRIWILENMLVQVQAKRWLHSVGRKEVAELRGSLQPFARGAVITTSHFTRAALYEATESGKNPIALVDGFRLSKIVLDEKFQILG